MESFVFFVRAKSHYFLHAAPVVPAAVENDDFTRRRQMFFSVSLMRFRSSIVSFQ
jgi:hypothetical protein